MGSFALLLLLIHLSGLLVEMNAVQCPVASCVTKSRLASMLLGQSCLRNQRKETCEGDKCIEVNLLISPGQLTGTEGLIWSFSTCEGQSINGTINTAGADVQPLKPNPITTMSTGITLIKNTTYNSGNSSTARTSTMPSITNATISTGTTIIKNTTNNSGNNSSTARTTTMPSITNATISTGITLTMNTTDDSGNNSSTANITTMPSKTTAMLSAITADNAAAENAPTPVADVQPPMSRHRRAVSYALSASNSRLPKLESVHIDLKPLCNGSAKNVTLSMSHNGTSLNITAIEQVVGCCNEPSCRPKPSDQSILLSLKTCQFTMNNLPNESLTFCRDSCWASYNRYKFGNETIQQGCLEDVVGDNSVFSNGGLGLTCTGTYKDWDCKKVDNEKFGLRCCENDECNNWKVKDARPCGGASHSTAAFSVFAVAVMTALSFRSDI